jgi:hypothetical protein
MSTVQDISGSIYHAAGQDTTPRFNSEGRVLECAGIVLDSVCIIGPYQAVLGRSRNKLFLEWLSIVFEECHSREENKLSLMSSFWSMLAGDVAGVWTVEEVPQPDVENAQQRIIFSLNLSKKCCHNW